MKIPDHIFGQPVEGALERYLKKSKEKEEPPSVQPTSSNSIQEVNLRDYILLPQHNLYVAKQVSYHGKNWYDAHDALHKHNARMLTIKEFVDFLQLLKSGNAKDGLNQKLPEDEVNALYDYITEKKDPSRYEWLDANFKVINGVLHINYYHQTVNRELKPQKSEPLEKCIMKDRYVNLSSANIQGLPTQKSRNQDFYYWHPLTDNNSVAGFFASSVRAYLDCSRDPRGSRSALGVRPAREKQ